MRQELCVCAGRHRSVGDGFFQCLDVCVSLCVFVLFGKLSVLEGKVLSESYLSLLRIEEKKPGLKYSLQTYSGGQWDKQNQIESQTSSL